MMEISEEVILNIWEIFYEYLPASKRNDAAVRYLKILLNQDIEISDLDGIRGEDEHLDYAIERLTEDIDYDENEYDE